MPFSLIFTKLVRSALIFIAIVVASPAMATSLWDQIQASGEVRVGSIDNRVPFMYKKDDKLSGFTVRISEDLVSALSNAMGKPIKVTYVPTTWATVVLDLQAGRVDVMFTMAATPERAKALDLFGPLYDLQSVAISSSANTIGTQWSYFNNPQTPISVIAGSADETIAKNNLPNGQIRSMKDQAGAVLDVQSGNSKAWITSVVNALNIQKNNPNFNKTVVLKPVVTQSSGGGIRKDVDGRFHTFLNGWSFVYRASGASKKAMIDSITEAGLSVDALPKDFDL
ncbi:transporter substrate-binding domain-containing protein [Agrobacterium tumefaciens]|uniref:transporter substrate-binding domain-containing protein n=1 Tax=Agrobacterium tumefaciens TaxID=358 RepID=UPI001574BAF9|nr:transporter substrate-binding domain-containing protein [Agrobacterium tumefaciens]NTE66246.1 transporter substrate-binding domain-containing protein [Agrobacterium tumefaciens]